LRPGPGSRSCTAAYEPLRLMTRPRADGGFWLKTESVPRRVAASSTMDRYLPVGALAPSGMVDRYAVNWPFIVILAGTFGVFALAGGGVMGGQLQAIGLGLALGVLLDTFGVRTLLVPSIVVLLGRWNWWPSRLGHRDGPAGPPGAEPSPRCQKRRSNTSTRFDAIKPLRVYLGANSALKYPPSHPTDAEAVRYERYAAIPQ
jgi:hypothetical protein